MNRYLRLFIFLIFASILIIPPNILAEEEETPPEETQEFEQESSSSEEPQSESPQGEEPKEEIKSNRSLGATQSSPESLSITSTAVEVEPSRGSSTISIPIGVPQGRGGIQPNLSLMYNSNLGNGFLGVGWMLDIGSIQRSTKDGVPRYDTSDEYVLVQAGASQELVYDEGGGFYRFKHEGSFMKIEKVNDTYWQVTDRGGVKYLFGTNASAREEDPNNNARKCKWYLDRVEDIHGNYMTISYEKEGENAYPKEIAYTGYGSTLTPYAKVKFSYEPKGDPILSYQSGFKKEITKALTKIDIEVEGNLVRRYEMGYSQEQETGRTLLSSIRHKGSDGETTQPATVFTYSQGETNFDTGEGLTNYPAQNLGENNLARFMDMDADGLLDMVVTFAGYGSSYRIYYNESTEGNIEFSGPKVADNSPRRGMDSGNVKLADLNGDGLMDVIDGSETPYRTWLNKGELGYHVPMAVDYHPEISIGHKNLVQLVDMNGDGLGDILETGSDGYKIYLGRGDGSFNAPIDTTNTPVVGRDNPDIKFGDFNGDGLLDVIYGQNQPYQMWINNGKDGYESPKEINNGPNRSISDQNLVQLVDMNGDGLIDMVETAPGSYKVYYNNGENDFEPAEELSNSPPRGTDNANVKFMDMNNDGIVDVLMGDEEEGWYVWLNEGREGFREAKGINAGIQEISNGNMAILDLNGDNLPDMVYGAAGDLPYKVWKNEEGGKSTKPGTLEEVNNTRGGITEIEYKNEAIRGMSGVRSKMGYGSGLLNTVKRITRTEGYGGKYISEYGYESGEWKQKEREFRGFGKVKITDAEGNYREIEYLQDDVFKGRVKEEGIYDREGQLYSRIENTWGTEEIIEGINFVYLRRVDKYQYDGNAMGRGTAEEYYYEESPQMGNLTRVEQLGEVDLNTGADIGEDLRVVETIYRNKTEGGEWLIGLPKQVIVKDNKREKVRESWFYYDGNDGLDDPIDKGLLTKKEEWGGDDPGSINPETEYTYDEYGNLLTTKDARKNVTRLRYDSDYQMFVVEVENAIGHKVRNRYYGVEGVSVDNGSGYRGLWGQIKGSIDANNQEREITYDEFGRVVATVSPLDLLEYPTEEIEYEVGSKYTKVIKRVRKDHRKEGTIDTVVYYDGLGRMIQSKARAEAEGVYVVEGQVEYNERGLVAVQYLPYFTSLGLDEIDSIDEARPRTQIMYDCLGRVIRAINPDGSYASISYEDWRVSSINENGHKQVSEYDAYGRLIKKEEYLGADGRNKYYAAESYRLSATTVYEYDSEGNLIETEDAQGNKIKMEYDKLGRKVKMIDPDMGTWEYGYDEVGNLEWQIDAKGKRIEFEYDEVNRLKRKSDGVVLEVVYTYDDERKENAKGRLTKVGYGAGEYTEFEYDELGREVKSKKVIKGEEYEVIRGYDALSRLKEVEYPDHGEVFYTYNEGGQVEKITPIDVPGNGDNDPVYLAAPYAQYKLNDNVGNRTVVDDGEGQNHGIATRGTSQMSVAGKINRAIYLNGQDDYVNVDGLLADIIEDDEGTFTMWIKPEKEESSALITFGGLGGYLSMEWGSDETVFFTLSGAGTPLSCRTERGSVPKGEYTHVAFAQDGGGLRIYINGEEKATDCDNGAWFSFLYSIWNGRIGASNNTEDPNANNNFFKGAIDDVRYYRRGLKEEEVKAIYNKEGDSPLAGTEQGIKIVLGDNSPRDTTREKRTVISELIDIFNIFKVKEVNAGEGAVQGQGNGLAGQYFKEYKTFVLLRTDAQVNFNWGLGGPAPEVGNDYFAVRWQGEIEAKYSEEYTFYTKNDNAVRLWIDGKMIIDKWEIGRSRESSGKIELERGRKYDIKLEYGTMYDASEMKLFWGGASQGKEIIPRAYLYSPKVLSHPEITKVETGDGKVRLEWGEVEGATMYQVNYGEENDGRYPEGSTLMYEREYTVEGLTNGKAYYFVVTAHNQEVGSAISKEVKAIPGMAAPELLEAEGGIKRVTLSWTEAPGAKGYKVKYGTTSGNYYSSKDVGNVRSYTVRDLIEGETYYFVVVGYDEWGESKESNELWAMPQGVPPDAPVIENIEAFDGEVYLSWNNVPEAEGYYVKYWKEDGSYEDIEDVGGQTDHYVGGLDNGQWYCFVVIAYNEWGESQESNELSAMPQGLPPDAPMIESIDPLDGEVNLSWSNVPEAEGYYVKYWKEDGSYEDIEDVGGQTDHYVGGLENGETYYFVVVAYNEWGESNESPEERVTPEAAVMAPQAPRLTGAKGGDGQVRLSWEKVSDAYEYQVKYGTSSGVYSTTKYAGDVTSVTIDNLNNGVTYYFVVVADNEGGESSISNELTATPRVIDKIMMVSNVDYNATGQIVKIEYGNGITTENTYDPLTLRLKLKYTYDGRGKPVQDLEYEYDGVGNVMEIIDNVHTGTQSFRYDAMNRLVYAQGAYGVKEYEYDEIGNIIKKDGLSYTYGEGNAGPHAVTSLSDGTNFTYDGNGNMATMQKSDELTEYIYDEENRLREVKKSGEKISTYEYDGDGGRTRKIVYGRDVSETDYVGSLYEERDNKGISYVYLGGSRVASLVDGVMMFYHQDHLGGTNVLTDVEGEVKELIEYKPYGSFSRHEKYGEEEEVAWFYFTGKKLDDETGLYYYGARYYDPSLGRFITPDTIVQAPDNPQTLNRYTYVNNNPVNLIDPSGHGWFKKFWKAAVTAIVGTVLIIASAGTLAPVVGTYWAGVATGAMVGATIGGTFAAATGGNIGMGLLTGAIGGGVFAGLAPGLGMLGDSLARGATLGGAAGPLSAGASAFSNFTAGFLGGAASGAAVAGVSGANVGRGALIGGAFGGAFSLARDAAGYARRKMIAQSRLNPKNASGKSAGFKGDGFKLGGGRVNPNNPNGGPSPLGGHQGGVGEIFGRPYAPGSFGDGLVEAFAGPHDYLNSWAYSANGNIASLNPVQQFITNFSNPGNVLLASPVVAASVLPGAAGGSGGIIYGQTYGDVTRQVRNGGGAESSLVVGF